MKACEDFLYIVLCAHIVAAAETIHKETPGLHVADMAKVIVQKFVNFLSEWNHTHIQEEVEMLNKEEDAYKDSIQEGQQQQHCEDTDELNNDDESATGLEQNDVTGCGTDMVYEYACEVLSLSLLWHSYHDAVKEGDGERVSVIWKYLLIVFMKTGRTNYTKEVLIQLLQSKFLFSERKAAQLKWDRFVNTQGKPGCNIPADLHMEHINKQFKGVLKNLGANVQPHTIVRASKAIGAIHDVSLALESELNFTCSSGKHNIPSVTKDIEKVVNVLQDVKVYERNKGRQHSFMKFNRGLLAAINHDEIAGKLLDKALNVSLLV